jgi:hypothetical protein
MLLRAQLGIGHVQKVGAPHDPSEHLPRLDVGAVIGDVAVVDVVVDGDRPVAADGEGPHELLEIGTVVFVVAVDDAQATATVPAGRPLRVHAREGDARGVVVEALEVHGELPHHVNDEAGSQAAQIALEEPIERATEAIVVDERQVLGLKLQLRGIEPTGPGGDAVEGMAAQGEVAHEEEGAVDGGELGSGIGRSEGLLEEGSKPQSLEEGAQEGLASHGEGFEGEGVGHPRSVPEGGPGGGKGLTAIGSYRIRDVGPGQEEIECRSLKTVATERSCGVTRRGTTTSRPRSSTSASSSRDLSWSGG